jgi:hypothetical protein
MGQHRDAAAPGRGPGRRPSRRRTATLLAGLTGLVVLTLGPGAIALGWHAYAQHQAAASASRHLLGGETPDGPAVFVVREIRCGEADGSVHGQRCVVTVVARNNGDRALTIPGIAQMLHGPDGVRHLPVPGDPAPFGTLAPGESATAAIEYDLPVHAEITHVGVRADAYSRGQAIHVSGRLLPLAPD